MDPSMTTIPRLVSVVEIIKREYMKAMDAGLAEGGVLNGLHQYNEIGSLEEEGLLGGAEGAEEQRQEAIARALQGRKQCVFVFPPRRAIAEERDSLKEKRTAFMRVTLSRKEVPGLAGRGAT